MAQPTVQVLDDCYVDLRRRATTDFMRHRAVLAVRAVDLTIPAQERTRLAAELVIVDDVRSRPGATEPGRAR